MIIYIGSSLLMVANRQLELITGRFGTSFLGGPRLEDQNGDGTWNTLDYVYQGSPEPDLFGGIRNVLSYKKWTLDTFAHFSIGNTMFNGSVAESYYATLQI